MPNEEFGREVVRIYGALAAPAYSLDKMLLVYMCLATVEYSLRRGFFEPAGRAVFTAYLWSVLQDFETTREDAEVLRRHYMEADPRNVDNRGLFALYGFSYHLVGTYKESIRQLERANHTLVLNGEVIFAANSNLYAAAMVLLTERKFEKASEKIERYREMSERLNYEIVIATFSSIEFFAHEFAGTPQLTRRDLVHTKEYVESQSSPLPRGWFYNLRLLHDVMKGEYQKAFGEIGDVEFAMQTAPFTPLTLHARAMASIVRMKCLNSLSRLERLRQKLKVRAQIRFFRKLSLTNPANFESVYLILKAQWDAMNGKATAAIQGFQAAASVAKNNEVIFYEPLAYTLMGEALLEQNLQKLAVVSLRDAVFTFESLGLAGLKAAMQKRFSQFNLAPGESLALGDSRSTMSLASTKELDLETVLKATNLLISEVEMKRLMRKMLDILIENAGAERAVLFLVENQKLIAKGDIHVSRREDLKLIDTPLENYNEVPRAMITYVQRTHETMVLDNAMEDDRLGRDEYVSRVKLHSSVCLPVLAHGELRGVVYLENNSAKGVFSPERVDMINVLSGQIAISLENARLYTQQAEAIRMQSELKTAHAVQEMLFPQPQFECEGVSISGFYHPATECGGDWWSYSQSGDWVYIYIGDATGHGAPAALITSAVCSAVSVIQAQPGLEPETALQQLNAAVSATAKGQINMTFLVGALNRVTGEFRFARASHEPPLLLRKSNISQKVSVRAALEPLMGNNGLPLGDSASEQYVPASVMLEPGDTIILYTDGFPDILSSKGETMGERRFFENVYRGCTENDSAKSASEAIVARAQKFRGERELRDDITLCILQFTGRAESGKSQDAA